MSRLIPVKYHKLNYPSHIEANICEVAGNFDVEKISVNTPYSLHTEYSYGERKFKSYIARDFGDIAYQGSKVPQLWWNKTWARHFFEFIKRLIGSNNPPDVLEIHPPFNDYCRSFDEFLEIFRVFNDEFNEEYTTTTILIENRCGTLNKGGKFLLSTCSDVLEFCNVLSNPNNSDINLKIVLDYPQIFSAIIDEDNKISMDNLKGAVEKIKLFNQELKKHSEVIAGFHMWGKRKGKNGKWVAHMGNFDTFFSNNNELKHEFLSSVFSTFNDGKARFFVPEVNSGESDLHSIVNDLEREGFNFTSKKCCKLRLIKQHFDRMLFLYGGGELPEYILETRKSGYIVKGNWHINFCFGEKDGKEYMDIYIQHHSMNRHMRIYEDGTDEVLPALDYSYYYIPNDTENNKKRIEEMEKKNDEIKKLLREKGFAI